MIFFKTTQLMSPANLSRVLQFINARIYKMIEYLYVNYQRKIQTTLEYKMLLSVKLSTVLV